MSGEYEKTLDLTRRWIAGAALPDLSLGRLAAGLDAARARRRRLQATALVLALAVVATWLVSIVGHPVGAPICAWVESADVVRYGVIHVCGFVLAALFVARVGALYQVLVRALWWSTLLASSLGMWTQSGTLPLLMPVLALASAWALLLLDDARLADDVGSGDFPLAAHRRSLMVMMVLAIADAETLLTAGLNHDEPGTLIYSLIDYGCAIAMIVAVIGLARLRTWGLLATVGLNLVIATLGLTGALFYDRGFAYLLGVTAAIQLVLCLPLLRRLSSGAPSGSPSGGARRARWPRGTRWIILALVLVDIVATVRASDPERVAARCAED